MKNHKEFKTRCIAKSEDMYFGSIFATWGTGDVCKFIRNKPVKNKTVRRQI